MKDYSKLVIELIKLPNETGYVEFKHNNMNPDMIGEDISALANTTTLMDRDAAYMIWGIDDETHEIIGTKYNRYSKLVGNQEIESWLRTLLSKNADFEFKDVTIDGKNLVVLVIKKAEGLPVSFKEETYIRVGSYTKPLKKYPMEESKLWEKLRTTKFEQAVAKSDLNKADIFALLDVTNYFDSLKITIPETQDAMMHYLLEDSIAVKQDNGLYAITNMGALLFAKKIADFPTVERKAIRVVQYEGNTKLNMLKPYNGMKGYAVGLQGLMDFLSGLLPSEEVITGGIRKTVTKYPMIALREIIVNALIHQDLYITGTGPLIEIYESRIEVTNPGTPLVDIHRIIDNPPRSRNEKLSALTRRLGLCEEFGSGWDRVALECEKMQLPAPKINLYEDSTQVVIYSEIPYSNISHDEKLWTCYLHSCIKYMQHDGLTNSSLRQRFGLDDKSASTISKLIKEAIEQNLIKPFDKDTAPRHMKYVPAWV